MPYSSLKPEQQLIVEQEYQKYKKSEGRMFLLWLFFGFHGAHRFYLQDNRRGMLMTVTFGGFGIIVLIDLFLMWGDLQKYNERVKQDLVDRLMAFAQASVPDQRSRRTA